MHNYMAPMIMKNFSLKQKENKRQLQLFRAIDAENLELVNQLLDEGIDPNYENNEILRSACKTNNYKIVKTLLDHGADPNYSSDITNDPLIFDTNSFKIVKLLHIHGADINAQDKDGGTLLMYNIFSPASINYLINFVNDYDVQDIIGHTALINTCIYGTNDTAKLLINAGADLNIQDNSGNTALMYACNNENMQIMLIKSGASVLPKNKNNKTIYELTNSIKVKKYINNLYLPTNLPPDIKRMIYDT